MSEQDEAQMDPPGAEAGARLAMGAVPEFDSAIEAKSVGLGHLIEALALKRASDDPGSRARYDRYFSELLKAYQSDGVTIDERYFCQNLPGGALLTRERSRSEEGLGTNRKRRRWQGAADDRYRIHIRYPTESVVTVNPEFAQVLWRCVALSKRATQLLRTQNSIAIHKSMYSVVVYLLSVLDTVQSAGSQSSSTPEAEEARRRRIQSAIADAHRRLDEAGRQFEASSRWGSNFAYFNGLLLGLAVLGAVVLTVVLGVVVVSANSAWEPTSTVQAFLAVTSAGGAGAVMSVMTRMGSPAFYLDPLAEHRAVWLLGAFRPLIGAVFGAATFLVVAGGLLDVVPDSVEASPTTELLFFAALGFLAGFNERFATGVLSNAAARTGEGLDARREAASSAGQRPDGVIDEDGVDTPTPR